MNKPKFFTGPNCAGCTQLKAAIEAAGHSDHFEFINVEEKPHIAHQFNIRSLPTVMTPEFDYFVGAGDVAKYVRSL